MSLSMDSVSSSFVDFIHFNYMIAIVCRGIKEIAAIYKILISLMCELSQPYLYKFNIPLSKTLETRDFIFSLVLQFLHAHNPKVTL